MKQRNECHCHCHFPPQAGLVTTLSTRTTVIGVTNPRAAYDPSGPISAATGLSSPLLSRFDIVLLLADGRNPGWDRAVAEHVLSNHQVIEERVVQGEGLGSGDRDRGDVATAGALTGVGAYVG